MQSSDTETWADLKRYFSNATPNEAIQRIRSIADPSLPIERLSRLAKVLDRTSRNDLGLTPIRIAILATSTIDHIVPLLEFWLRLDGFEPEFYVSPFNTLDQTLYDPRSELYTFRPDVIWLATNFRDVQLETLILADEKQVDEAVDAAVSQFTNRWRFIRNHSQAVIIQNNAEPPPTRHLGNFACAAPWSHSSLLARFNLRLAAASIDGVVIADICTSAAQYGLTRWHDQRWWFHSKHAIPIDASADVSHAISKIVTASSGRSKKCLVLDLDNTLWGGIIGDDGLEGIRLGPDTGAEGEAFSAFQFYLLQLKRRGIILCVCSKNELANAQAPFQSHSGMHLRLEDIAVFRANWTDKATNIREIASTLNIGLDSMVFVDDNPVERSLVATQLPMVVVPEIPTDPADYIWSIERLRLFETTSFSSEDSFRSDTYRQNSQRAEAQQESVDLESFLKSLQMESEFRPLDEFHLSRFSQLLNKSNQFHLTTTRYTAPQIQGYLDSPSSYCIYFKLRDRFGDYGLIAAIILTEDSLQGKRGLRIDTWAMSCRVLNRGMEEFIVQQLLRLARIGSHPYLFGIYKPTKKNTLVKSLYERLGFTLVSDDAGTTAWELTVTEEQPATHIQPTKESQVALSDSMESVLH